MLFGILTFALLFSYCYAVGLVTVAQTDPDTELNITQLIESKGYPCEEHKVITSDGYILGVFRIPHGRKSTTHGRPVLLQHGLLDAATTWVINFPDQSLGFILADAGYDVWLGNMRGTSYSRAHVKYNPDKDDAFWDFSWDDMSRDDLPSMIRYILSVTKQEQIAYVGHSQGTMIAFAELGRLGSTIRQNVSFFGALAPVALLGNIKSPITKLAPFSSSVITETAWYLVFGTKEFRPPSSITKLISGLGCRLIVSNQAVCGNLFFLYFGPETIHLNQSRLAVYMAHVPQGTSVKNVIHYAQGVQAKTFQAYDYGSSKKNQDHYNQTTPPQYSIRTMQVPTAVFSGDADWLADPKDVTFILNNVPNIVYKKVISSYNHVDFIWGLTANTLIYADLLNVMKTYHPSY